MTEHELLDLIAMGEGFQAEFKLTVPSKIKEIAEEVCAFANAAGGRLIMGVSDNNAISGVELSNNQLSRIQNGISEIKPRLDCKIEQIKIENRTVIVITVPSGAAKPYILSGAVFMRMGPNTQKLTQPEEIHEIFQQSGKIYFDESVSMIRTNELAWDEIQKFRMLAGFDSSISDDHLVENLRLTDHDGRLKNAAVLFFTGNPQKLFEHAIVRCLYFEGFTKRVILDDKIIDGTVHNQYFGAISWLKTKLDVRYDIEGQGSKPRKEIWEIPETAIKEALVNALAHRNYYDKGGVIMVELFADRLEIGNPGGLVRAIPEKMFGRKSHTRNPMIFGLLARIRLVEKIGSGVPRMRALMRDAQLPPPTFETRESFNVTFYRPVNFDKWVNRWVETLTENRINLLRAIHDSPEITIQEMGRKIKLSSSAIDKNIDFLKNLGLVSREGSAKGGYWKIHFIHPESG
jgi:ATP-dependent DNA helicase RecG